MSVADLPVGGARADLSAAAFRADIDGMILWFPNFQFVWSPNNYDVRRQGIELTGTARMPNRAIELTGSVSHVSATYAGPVLRGQLVYRPRLTANASLRATAASLELLAQYRYVGERRTVPGSALNVLPAFDAVDLQLTRPIPLGGWKSEVMAGVDNLLDQDATMLVDYPVPGRSWRLGVHITLGD